MKFKKRKGYTLIEIVAGIAISAIAMMIGITIIINSYKNYMNIKEYAIRKDEIDNALLTIDLLLTEYMIKEIKPNINENKIRIDYLIEHGKAPVKGKVIAMSGENLVVDTHDSEILDSVVNTMPILRGIKDFSVIKKGKLYYYKITLKTGEDIINCI